MEWQAGLIWVLLFALLWARWLLRERPWLRDQARHKQAATQEPIVRQHADAGMQLMQEKKWPEAIDAFDRALDALQDAPSQEVLIRFYRGFALEQTGELEEAIADYEDCEAVYEHLHQDPQYVAAVRKGLLLARLGRNQEAEQHLRRTIAALQRGPQSLSWLQIEAFQVLVGLSHHARDHVLAIESAKEGARAAHRLHNAAAQAGFLRAAGGELQALDRPEEALHSYEQSLDLYRRIGGTGGGAMVKHDIARLYQLDGRWDRALDWLQACLADEERDQNKRRQAQLCYDIACLHIDQGNLQDAGRLLQRSMSLFRQTEDHDGIDQVGRTMMGLSILVHRRITAHQMTFRDVERGVKSKKEGN